jgi:tetratricopeptide (TPR) repeat protein
MTVRGRIVCAPALTLLVALALLLVVDIQPVFAWQATPPAKVEPPKDPKTIQLEGIVTQATQLIREGKYDAGIQEADKALAIDAKFAAAQVARGMAFNGKGEYDTAMKEFDLVTAITGREPEKLQNRADAYAHRSHSLYQKGQYLDAIDNAYFATLEKFDHPLAHINRAAAYVARQDFDRAINSANRAINIDENSAEAYSIRSLAYAGKKNADQAIKDADKAIALNSKLAESFQRRAVAFVVKGDAAKAKQDLDQALVLKPNHADALCDRALLYGMAGDLPKAMIDLDAALKANPHSGRVHYVRGLAELEQSNFDKAVASFDEAIRLQEKNALAYSSRGYARNGRKEYDKAREDFTKAIELDSKLASAYSGRNTALKNLGLTKEASADNAKYKELTAPPKKAEKKDNKKEEEAPAFVVKSKAVAPEKRATMLKSAKEIDRLIAANYEKVAVKPNARTTDEQFLRRIYLDVTGTIPTYNQTRKFLTSSDPNKRTLLIDELLSSDGYASHSFNYWADILRYTDNLNGTVRGEPYRQWIKQSLAESKPWDKMVHEMMTAEGLIWKNPATGYMQRDASMPLDNMNNTVRIFLGTRIGCAQCHDHPFDRWTQKEFYQMAAFTYGTLTSTNGGDKRYWESNPDDRLQTEYAMIEQEEEDRRNNNYRFDRLISINMMMVNDQVDRKITLPKDYQYDNAKAGDVVEPKSLFGASAEIKKGETPRQAFARWLTAKENPRFALTIANRLWKQAFGIGQIEPVDDMMDTTVAENPELMVFLEAEMKRLNFDMKEYLRVLYNTETYQRQVSVEEVNPGETYHFSGPVLRRMTAEQVWDSFLTLAVPDDYREMPATLRTDVIGVDLTSVKAPDLLAADSMGNQVDGSVGKWQQKHIYKGVLLARASELPSPVPASHFLRMFGQSDRELISASSTMGSVPQVLFMFNGPISHMLLESNSTIYNTVMKKKSINDGIRSIFLTILNREPDTEELALAVKEVNDNGAPGYGNVIWSLVNTREFLFIQ